MHSRRIHLSVIFSGLLLACATATEALAQEDTLPRLPGGTTIPEMSLIRSEDVLYPDRPSLDGGYRIYALQRYNELELTLDAMQSVPGSEIILMNAMEEDDEAGRQPLASDRGVAMFNMYPPPVSSCSRKRHSTLYQIVRGTLLMAMQFGYGYMREKVRTMNASDMDALHLPVGTGVYRDMNIIMMEASQRSDYSTISVWQDILYRQRLERNRSQQRRELEGH
jgi:hypothetical protein